MRARLAGFEELVPLLAGQEPDPPLRLLGAADPKAGYCGTLGNVVQDPRLNHRLEVTAGVLAEECGALLSGFFADLRRGRPRMT